MTFDTETTSSLRSLGIEKCSPEEIGAQECVDQAVHAMDLLLHHGSRFVGPKGQAQNDWFLESLTRLRVRMLVQRPETEEESQVFRDLASRYPDFSYAFYSGTPLLRIVNIDRGRLCYLSHYANEIANRAEGSRSAAPSPQFKLVNTESSSLTYLAERLFDEWWNRGVSS